MYDGIGKLSAVLGGAINGRTRQDAFANETRNLANFDYLQAGVKSKEAGAESSLAEAMKHKAQAALFDAQAATTKGANDLHLDPNNYAPMLAARGGVPLELAQSFIQSLTKGGARPELAPDVGNQLSELYASLSGLRFAGKGTGGEDIPAILSGSLRNAAGRSAITQSPTNPTQAAWNMSLANNKDEPKLYAANGEQGVYSTLTGDQSSVPGAPKGPKAPVGYRYKADGSSLEAIPGGPGEIAINERGLKREEIATRRDQMAQDRSDRITERRAADLDKKVTKFSGELGGTGIPETTSLLSGIEQRLAQYNGKPIPGYGVIEGALPDLMVSKEGKELRQEIMKLFNITLKNRSGGAVTSQELDRLKREFGTGGSKTEDQLRQGLMSYRREFDALQRNVLAGVDNDVLDEYEARGGSKQPRTDRDPNKGGAKTPASGNGYGGYSEDQVQATMKAHGKTRQEVIRAIDAKGKRPKT